MDSMPANQVVIRCPKCDASFFSQALASTAGSNGYFTFHDSKEQCPRCGGLVPLPNGYAAHGNFREFAAAIVDEVFNTATPVETARIATEELTKLGENPAPDALEKASTIPGLGWLKRLDEKLSDGVAPGQHRANRIQIGLAVLAVLVGLPHSPDLAVQRNAVEEVKKLAIDAAIAESRKSLKNFHVYGKDRYGALITISVSAVDEASARRKYESYGLAFDRLEPCD